MNGAEIDASTDGVTITCESVNESCETRMSECSSAAPLSGTVRVSMREVNVTEGGEQVKSGVERDGRGSERGVLSEDATEMVPEENSVD